MEKRQRRRFTDEFKAKAIQLVQSSNKTVAEVARDLDLTPSALGAWVMQAEIDGGRGPAGALTTEEREELSRLRKENRILKEEREILKKAAAHSIRQRNTTDNSTARSTEVEVLSWSTIQPKSGYYAWCKRVPSLHLHRGCASRNARRHSASRRPWRVRSPRVLRELRAHGERTSRKRLARLMHERGLADQPQKRWRHPPGGDLQSLHAQAVYRNDDLDVDGWRDANVQPSDDESELRILQRWRRG